MKMSRPRQEDALNTPPADASPTGRSMTSVSYEQVAERSFELFCARGCEDGHDLDDWFQAERDLQQRGDRQ
jgi:hypothetical protein